MDAISAWAKENFDLITLFVGFVGVVLAVISLILELKKRNQRKQELKNQIATKEAQLHAMEMSIKAGFNVSEYGGLEMQKSALQAEIEQLKKQL